MSDHVLVVEDDGELRDFLVEVLNTAGHVTTGFATADAALRAVATGEPADVVVTDLIMPGIPGAELLRALRQQRPELNVIVMTAFGSIDSAVELVRAGAYDYLTKPIATQELLLAVSHALDQSRLRREVARLGRSAMAQRFALSSLEEASAYLAHPVLGRRLRECAMLVAGISGRSITEIFGHPDDMKFRSSMTLFARAASDEPIFATCLRQYFGGEPDPQTLANL